jgi:DNA-binding response OmpR family regulator
VVVIDPDRGFTHVLGERFEAQGWLCTAVAKPVSPPALVRLRPSALIVDASALGPCHESYLDEVCARLPMLAVTVCTGPSSVAERVSALRLGVDAWVSKPCHPDELIAVVDATLLGNRPDGLAVVDAPAVRAELTIRAELHQAFVGGKSLELTSREFEILQLLAHADRVLRREEVYERVWGYAMADGDRSVDVFVRRLRQKLKAASPGWTYIDTHFGVGYRFAPAARVAERPRVAAGHSQVVHTSARSL